MGRRVRHGRLRLAIGLLRERTIKHLRRRIIAAPMGRVRIRRYVGEHHAGCGQQQEAGSKRFAKRVNLTAHKFFKNCSSY